MCFVFTGQCVRKHIHMAVISILNQIPLHLAVKHKQHKSKLKQKWLSYYTLHVLLFISVS